VFISQLSVKFFLQLIEYSQFFSVDIQVFSRNYNTSSLQFEWILIGPRTLQGYYIAEVLLLLVYLVVYEYSIIFDYSGVF